MEHMQMHKKTLAREDKQVPVQHSQIVQNINTSEWLKTDFKTEYETNDSQVRVDYAQLIYMAAW